MTVSYPLGVALAVLLFSGVIVCFVLWQEKERVLRLAATGLMAIVIVVLVLAVVQLYSTVPAWSW